jgi:hypothetical protein
MIPQSQRELITVCNECMVPTGMARHPAIALAAVERRHPAHMEFEFLATPREELAIKHFGHHKPVSVTYRPHRPNDASESEPSEEHRGREVHGLIRVIFITFCGLTRIQKHEVCVR